MTLAIDLVIFDCDGVLVDSEMIASRIVAAELTRHGLPHTPEQCRDRYTGLSFASLIAKAKAAGGAKLPVDFEARVRRKDVPAFEAELTAVPGIQQALTALTPPVCVASSGTMIKIQHSLRLTGLTAFFDDRLFSATQVANGKPAPDLFLFAARAMAVAPARCLVIEDSHSGVRGAKAAGMTVYGFTGGAHCGPGTGDGLRAAGGDRVFDQMAVLPGLVNGNNSG